jgi:hypothetical protein
MHVAGEHVDASRAAFVDHTREVGQGCVRAHHVLGQVGEQRLEAHERSSRPRRQVVQGASHAHVYVRAARQRQRHRHVARAVR